MKTCLLYLVPLLGVLVPSQASAVVIIDFGTMDLGSLAVYEEDGFRLTAIDNGLAPNNHFDIHGGDGDANLSLHGGDEVSYNAEEVVLTAIDNSPFTLLGFGAEASEGDLWEMVSSSGALFTFSAGESIYTLSEFGTGFSNVTSVTFRSNTIPLMPVTRTFSIDTINIGAIPEPGTALLMMIGVAPLLGYSRRRRAPR